jgi:hypothetical protein
MAWYAETFFSIGGSAEYFQIVILKPGAYVSGSLKKELKTWHDLFLLVEDIKEYHSMAIFVPNFTFPQHIDYTEKGNRALTGYQRANQGGDGAFLKIDQYIDNAYWTQKLFFQKLEVYQVAKTVPIYTLLAEKVFSFSWPAEKEK